MQSYCDHVTMIAGAIRVTRLLGGTFACVRYNQEQCHYLCCMLGCKQDLLAAVPRCPVYVIVRYSPFTPSPPPPAAGRHTAVSPTPFFFFCFFCFCFFVFFCYMMVDMLLPVPMFRSNMGALCHNSSWKSLTRVQAFDTCMTVKR